jgi:hypothetical protein
MIEMSNYPVVAGSQQLVPYQSQARSGSAAAVGADKKARKPETKFAKALGAGFVAIDSYSRIKDGENPVMAVGKAVLTNALFMSMGPVAGTAAALGIAAVQMAPAAVRAFDSAKSSHGAKGMMFGGGFAETEGQSYLKQMGMSNMAAARGQAAAVMSNHARGAFKTY